jgi:hypothetical protein
MERQHIRGAAEACERGDFAHALLWLEPVLIEAPRWLQPEDAVLLLECRDELHQHERKVKG